MLRFFIVAAFALASVPALAQQQGGGGGGGGTVTGCETSGTGVQKGNGSGGCAAAATSDLHALSAQLTSATTNGNGNYTIAATTFRAATSATLTAPRVWTLPAAASVNAGDVVVVSDDAGGVSATDTLTIARAGSDTINGGTSAVINAAYGALGFKSNGANAWTVVDGATLQPITCVSHEWMEAVASTGTITCTQPATGDISGLGSLATQSAASVAITGGTIDGTAIGGTTRAALAATTGNFSGALTTDVTGTTQCLHANSSGVVSGTGSDCGSGGGGGGVTSITAGTGLTGGTITSTGTIDVGFEHPEGRISDSSSSCAHGSDSTTIQTLYYVAGCPGGFVPVSPDGTNVKLYAIPSTSTDLSTANATNFTASTLYDFYAFLNSGAVAYCAVPWGTSAAGSSSRGSNAGTTTLNGLTVNSGAWSCYNGGTSYTLTAKEATLLGTFYIGPTAEDVVMQMAPAAAAGGPSGGCTIGYANLYNQAPSSCVSEDSTSSWTYSAATWEALDAGATGSGLGNRVTWVDPIGTIAVDALHLNAVVSGSTNKPPEIGIGVNSTSSPSGVIGGAGTSAFSVPVVAMYAGPAPQAGGGLNYVQALQWMVAGTTGTYYGSGVSNGTGQSQGLRFRGMY